jgi:hypothetical protein
MKLGMSMAEFHFTFFSFTLFSSSKNCLIQFFNSNKKVIFILLLCRNKFSFSIFFWVKIKNSIWRRKGENTKFLQPFSECQMNLKKMLLNSKVWNYFLDNPAILTLLTQIQYPKKNILNETNFHHIKYLIKEKEFSHTCNITRFPVKSRTVSKKVQKMSSSRVRKF